MGKEKEKDKARRERTTKEEKEIGTRKERIRRDTKGMTAKDGTKDGAKDGTKEEKEKAKESKETKEKEEMRTTKEHKEKGKERAILMQASSVTYVRSMAT